MEYRTRNPETTFGGDFATPTDYLDPFIRQKLSEPGNWALFAPIPYGPKTLNYFAKSPNPAAPTAENWLGTDDQARDVLARVIYGDLKNNGLFKPVGPDALPAIPYGEVAAPAFANWRGRSAEMLVQGFVKAVNRAIGDVLAKVQQVVPLESIRWVVCFCCD